MMSIIFLTKLLIIVKPIKNNVLFISQSNTSQSEKILAHKT
jgi:hypothetical protein